MQGRGGEAVMSGWVEMLVCWAGAGVACGEVVREEEESWGRWQCGGICID